MARLSAFLRLTAAFVACLVLLFAARGAQAAESSSRYPLDLDTAVSRAYPGPFAGIERSCVVWLNGGRDEYALAQVSLRGGGTDTAGFQFINTAGWFNMWRAHTATTAVPKPQRPVVSALVRRLATKCAVRWAP
jgi:hypothetical protein